MLKPFASAIAVVSTFCFTAFASLPEPPRVSEAEIQQITPVVYRYIASHHMPDTIVSFEHGDKGKVEVRTHEDNLFILQRSREGWKMIRVQKYVPDREMVR